MHQMDKEGKKEKPVILGRRETLKKDMEDVEGERVRRNQERFIGGGREKGVLEMIRFGENRERRNVQYLLNLVMSYLTSE